LSAQRQPKWIHGRTNNPAPSRCMDENWAIEKSLSCDRIASDVAPHERPACYAARANGFAPLAGRFRNVLRKVCLSWIPDGYTQNAVFDSFEKSQRVTSSQVGFFVSFAKTAFSVSRTRFFWFCVIGFDSPLPHPSSTLSEVLILREEIHARIQHSSEGLFRVPLVQKSILPRR